jgi:dinuclear metal center YbgI/SA1388 family protein
MRVRDAVEVLERLVPLRYAEAWDNVGLLVGDREAAVSGVLVTVDYTEAVAAEAIEKGASLVVAYHPPLFAATKRAPHDAPWVHAIRHGVALWSMHTALDVVRGGTNDVLADACGVDGAARRPLRVHAGKDAETKLVTFVPEADLDRVSEALFAAGAGRIGAYSRCSFRTNGTGTFFGHAGTNPAIGERGTLETVSEVRLETVVPAASLARVVAALRAAHPYEEPAFDLVRLAAAPEGLGLGRVGPVAGGPVPREDIVLRVKAALGLEHVLVCGPRGGQAACVAVAAGAGGELLDLAASAGADVFVTGELRHHDALAAARRGMTVVATLHSNSERNAVRAFAARLAAEPALAAVPVLTSEADRDPFGFA